MHIHPPGTKIGQYRVRSSPMMGGMGVVYICHHLANDRAVALKTFKPEYLLNQDARDRFLREGTTWMELGKHPHIVRCYEVIYIDPTVFLVLELIAKEQNMPNASLRSWLISGQPLPIKQALLFALQIARGMQHATEKISGFVHRDLKPENILVGADRLPGTNINRLRITDFGLVKVVDDGKMPAIRKTDEIKPNQIQFTSGVGTPLYMAPEQWTGGAVGVYTDVYALGCILYELLTGERVAGGKTIRDWQTAHCGGKLRPVPRDLPVGVQAFLRRSLALAGLDRYRAWNEVIDALQALGADLPVLTQTSDSRARRLDMASSYNELGHSYLDMGKAHGAIDYYEKALKICREIGDRHGEGAALNNLGNAYRNLGDIQRAIGYYEQYLGITRELGDRRGEGTVLGNLGIAYNDLGDARRAISYFEKCLILCREIGDQKIESITLGNLGVAYKNLGDVRGAIGYYEQYLRVARDTGDQRGEDGALGNLGNAYSLLGDMQRAISYYEQALEIARKLGSRYQEGTALGNIGIVHENLGNIQRAVGYYHESLIIKREIGNRQGEAKTLGNLGGVYAELGDIRRAIGYIEEQLEIVREIGDQRGEGAALGNLGNAYVGLGDMRRAIGYYEESIAIGREIGDLDGVAHSLFNMARFYAEQGQIQQAFPLAKEAEQIWVQIGSPDVQKAQQLLDWLQSSNASTHAAFKAFQRADSLHEMQAAVSQYPFMKDDDFIQVVRRVIDQQVRPEHKPAFEQRLVGLRKIAEK